METGWESQAERVTTQWVRQKSIISALQIHWEWERAFCRQARRREGSMKKLTRERRLWKRVGWPLGAEGRRWCRQIPWISRFLDTALWRGPDMVQQTMAPMEKVSISKRRNHPWHRATATLGRAANWMAVKELWATEVPEPVRGRGAEEASTDSSFPSRPTGEHAQLLSTTESRVQARRNSQLLLLLSCWVMSDSYLPGVLDCRTPGFPVLPSLSELAQSHVHWVSDAIQLSHSLVPFSLRPQFFPASGSFPRSRLFVLGGQSIEASASVPPMNTQGWFPLGLTGLISLQSKGLSGVFSNTTAANYQFFGTQSSLWSNSHIHTWLMKKP